MRFMTEAKVLPAGVLNRKVNEKANRRKPGKKELCDLTGEPTLDLLPMVFASARQAHERLCQMAQRAGGKPPEPFTKPHGFALRCAYIPQEAAQQCRELAGRLTIQIQEIKTVTA